MHTGPRVIFMARICRKRRIRTPNSPTLPPIVSKTKILNKIIPIMLCPVRRIFFLPIVSTISVLIKVETTCNKDS